MPRNYKKERIPAAVRNTVWLKWVEDKNNAKCFCCKLEPITNANWHCGHIISEKNGGKIHLNNLRPICAGCNCSMGTTNMNDFIKKYGFDIINNQINMNKIKRSKIPELEKIKSDFQKLKSKIEEKDKQAKKFRAEIRKLKLKNENLEAEIINLKKSTNSKKGLKNNMQKFDLKLLKFLGVSKEGEISRLAVTLRINNYIRNNNLQDPLNGRVIIPDKTLKKLLNIKKKDKLTYFNMQKYLNPLFIKK